LDRLLAAQLAPRSHSSRQRFLSCQVVPAAYQQNNPSDPSDYGNYDLAFRPTDGLGIRFVVIHDTEVGYDDTIRLFQNPLAYVSAHYVLRSSDGQVTQMVPTRDVAWQDGNWWITRTRSGSRTRALRYRATSGTRLGCTARSAA
jgi:N-acetyl-anhydromuramyl-L-alanine amidase AmpD